MFCIGGSLGIGESTKDSLFQGDFQGAGKSVIQTIDFKAADLNVIDPLSCHTFFLNP